MTASIRISTLCRPAFLLCEHNLQNMTHAGPDGNISLAAELYERHEDTAYREQAAQCLTWMERHMLDDDSGLMFDHLDGRDGRLIDWRFTYNLALYIREPSHCYCNATGLHEQQMLQQFWVYTMRRGMLKRYGLQDGLSKRLSGMTIVASV